MRNKNQKFVSKTVQIRSETNGNALLADLPVGSVLQMPVAHAEGRFLIDDDGLRQLIDNDQILFRYCDAEGNVDDVHNFNGSVDSIAGICNRQRNVFGMMPHPENLIEAAHGGSDGTALFTAALGVAA